MTLPTINSKNLSSITHAFLCTLHVLFNRVDVVHYFTTGTTLFAPLPRFAGMKTVCSVDGTDWQRQKWGFLARLYLRISERLAVLLCNELIGDSADVVRYYWRKYGVEPVLSTYGIRERTTVGRKWLERFGLREGDYVLFVGRLVPENNVHVLISAYERIASDKKLVIVGDDPWGKRYVRSLRGTRDQRIIFTGGVYGEGYEELQQNAYLFVLPDEVGGTHPSLVEAMGFGNCVLVNDTPSNLEVVAEAGFSYRGSEGDRDLERQLRKLLSDPALVQEYRKKARKHAMQTYRWDHVVAEHERLYQRLLGVDIRTETETASSVSNTAD